MFHEKTPSLLFNEYLRIKSGTIMLIEAVRALFAFTLVLRRVDACLCSADGDLCSQYDQASVVIHVEVLSSVR